MPKYRFDKERQQYQTESGKPLKSSTVRGWIDQAVDKTKVTIAGLAERYNQGEINHAEFLTSAKSELKRMHTGLAAIAVGGKAQLSQSDLGRLGAQVREQYKYFDRLALQLESGEQAANNSLLIRISMYADAGVHTYERLRQASHREVGFDEERNILGSNNSCEECPAESAKDWQPIGSLIPTGARACLSRCRCHLEYRKTQ